MKVLIAVCCIVAVGLAQDQGPPPPPPFLEGASQPDMDAWNTLTQKFGGETEQQVSDDVDAFVAAHPDLQDKYAAFKEKVLSDQKTAEEQHQVKVSSLSPEAQAADKQLAGIAAQPELTHEQKLKQIVQTFNALPPSVQDELKGAGQ